MSKIVMNIKNEQNLKAMISWCEQYHIEYQLIEDTNNMPKLVDDNAQTAPTPKQYTTTKGLKDIKYTITKVGSLYCISRGAVDENGKFGHGGWTRAEKACINNAIKSLDGIKTQKKEVEYTTWGYDTKKKAQEMVATLPTEFSAEEIAKFDRK